jgi:hypothetical protein
MESAMHYVVKFITPHTMEDRAVYMGPSLEIAEQKFQRHRLNENKDLRILCLEKVIGDKTVTLEVAVDFKDPKGIQTWMQNKEVDPAFKRFYNFLLQYIGNVVPLPG